VLRATGRESTATTATTAIPAVILQSIGIVSGDEALRAVVADQIVGALQRLHKQGAITKYGRGRVTRWTLASGWINATT
jgi:non-canonical (house-cleaning) NTP pyrophosphatase